MIQLLHHHLDDIAGLEHLLEIRIDHEKSFAVSGPVRRRFAHAISSKASLATVRADLHQIIVLRHFADEPLRDSLHLHRLLSRR